MLRASSQRTDQAVDLKAVGDVTRDPLLVAGAELRELTDAAVLRDPFERDIALPALVAATDEAGGARAAAVAGNFEMMNRLLDGIGVGPPDTLLDIGTELNVSYPLTR